jgi:hypothetical protein
VCPTDRQLRKERERERESGCERERERESGTSEREKRERNGRERETRKPKRGRVGERERASKRERESPKGRVAAKERERETATEGEGNGQTLRLGIEREGERGIQQERQGTRKPNNCDRKQMKTSASLSLSLAASNLFSFSRSPFEKVQSGWAIEIARMTLTIKLDGSLGLPLSQRRLLSLSLSLSATDHALGRKETHESKPRKREREGKGAADE